MLSFFGWKFFFLLFMVMLWLQQQRLKNPTRYHVLQSHKRQMREYVSHKHHLLGPPQTTFQPHSAPERVPGGQRGGGQEKDEETIITPFSAAATAAAGRGSEQSYFCSTSAPEPAQISTKEAPSVNEAAEAVVSSRRLSKPSKSKGESPERINFNTDNASGAIASSASKVRPLHRS